MSFPDTDWLPGHVLEDGTVRVTIPIVHGPADPREAYWFREWQRANDRAAVAEAMFVRAQRQVLALRSRLRSLRREEREAAHPPGGAA